MYRWFPNRDQVKPDFLTVGVVDVRFFSSLHCGGLYPAAHDVVIISHRRHFDVIVMLLVNSRKCNSLYKKKKEFRGTSASLVHCN